MRDDLCPAGSQRLFVCYKRHLGLPEVLVQGHTRDGINSIQIPILDNDLWFVSRMLRNLYTIL
jgi:hypothetical protein